MPSWALYVQIWGIVKEFPLAYISIYIYRHLYIYIYIPLYTLLGSPLPVCACPRMEMKIDFIPSASSDRLIVGLIDISAHEDSEAIVNSVEMNALID